MTQPAAEKVIWLTQEAYDRLSAELVQLKGPARAEIARRIADAREEGDLKENGGYHAAKEEQGKLEARIRQLDELIRARLVGQGVRATLAPTTEGPRVMVFDEEASVARALLKKR